MEYMKVSSNFLDLSFKYTSQKIYYLFPKIKEKNIFNIIEFYITKKIVSSE